MARNQKQTTDKEATKCDALYRKFRRQKAQITKDQVYAIEASFTDSNRGVWRRLALASLSLAGREMIEATKGADRGLAVELARAADFARDYAGKLRSFADLMETASTRQMMALCVREDYLDVTAAARAPITEEAVA